MSVRKKTVILSLVSLILVIGCLGFFITVHNNDIFPTNSLEQSNDDGLAIWRETPINDGAYLAHGDVIEFDLRKTIKEADYVFSGTVVSRKEYEVEWTDENGEHWGPFLKSIIEVKVGKEYYGNSPVDGNIIKVYYPYGLSMVFEDSFLIEDSSEYIFVTQALDKEFTDLRAKTSPEDKFGQERYADVYISNSHSNLLSISDNTVFMYREYFSWDEKIMKQTKEGSAVTTDKILSAELLENNYFIALSRNDFDNAFAKLFDNSVKLPTADELKSLRERETDNTSQAFKDIA